MSKMRIISALSLLFVVALNQSVKAQLTARSFGLVYSKNTRGGVTTFGNTVMNAVNTNGSPNLTYMNETSNANNGQGGLGFSQYGNDNSDMRQLDIDAVSSTYNSSSADLALPSGSNTILFARLYWGARIDSGAYSQSLDTLKKIRLRKGTTGNYSQIIAQDLDTIVSSDRTNLVYQASADITAFIQSNGGGTYTVADIPLTELDLTGGQYGGWAITVAYENPTLPYYSIRVYDGFAQVYNAGNAGTLAITLTGLNVPGTPLAAADAVMGSVAWEGDASLSGDYIKINNVTVSNLLNPSNNFFNGSISKDAVFVSSKNPNYSNQMGVDIDEVNVGSGYNIGANATSINILFGTTADMYFPGVFTFVMKSKEPTVKITKTVTDANGNGLVDNNEILTYTLAGNNLGPDSSYNTYIIDTIPANVAYVPGSLEVINAPGVSSGIKSDATGDDEAFITTVGTKKIVRFNIGYGSTPTAGGKLPVLAGSEYLLRFKVKAPANASTVTNLGRVYGQSVNNEPFTDESSATIYLNTTLGLGESDTACNSYTWNGNTYTQSGTYTNSYINTSGNPITDTLYLTVNYSQTSNTDIAICSSSLPYTWNGQDYNAAGTYSVSLTTAAGCDSTAILHLIVNQPNASSSTYLVCPNELPYSWNGQTYSAAGSYSVTLVNSVGCDSVAVLTLILKSPTTSLTDITSCNSYSWNGVVYTQTGNYSASGFTNAEGCDSTAFLNLTIRISTSSDTAVSACSNYVWNGATYTQSGNYSFNGINAVGCDSLAVLHLVINQPTTSYSDIEICPSQLPYSWNGLTFTQGGAQTVILTNAAGCDSMATLTLWIKPVSSSITPVAICASALPYSWNGQSYAAAGTYSAILTNVFGCDSTATLELTVKQETSSLTQDAVCTNALPYSWNGQSYSAAGSYTATLTNAAGCDSIAVLELSILPSSSMMIDTSVCQSSLPFIWNGQSYDSSGDYTIILTNAYGCDSVVMLMLSVTNCDPPCITDNFNSTPEGWTLSQGARFFDYINPANNCSADKGIITPGVGGNNPAFIRTPVYISSGPAKLRMSFDIYVLDANLKCNTWKNYNCPTSIDVFYIAGGIRYPGVIDFLLPPNGPGNSPNVVVEFLVGSNLPAGTPYSIEVAFKFKSGTGGSIQQNTKYVIDNFSICEKLCATCPSAPVYSRAAAGQQTTADIVQTIKVWPVPSSGMIYFSSSSAPLEKAEVIDMMGNIVFVSQNTASGRLNLTNLNPGYYILRLSSSKGTTSSRICLTK
jgi:hypothetical protein